MNNLLNIVGAIFMLLVGLFSLYKFFKGFGIAFNAGGIDLKGKIRQGREYSSGFFMPRKREWPLIVPNYVPNASLTRKAFLFFFSLVFILTGLILLFLSFNPDFVSIF